MRIGHNEIVVLDRAYINYAKFEELTDRDVVYVTKMKKSLNYEVIVDCMHQRPQGLMEYREQVVVFRKDAVKFLNFYCLIEVYNDFICYICSSKYMNFSKTAYKTLLFGVLVVGLLAYIMRFTYFDGDDQKVAQDKKYCVLLVISSL